MTSNEVVNVSDIPNSFCYFNSAIPLEAQISIQATELLIYFAYLIHIKRNYSDVIEGQLKKLLVFLLFILMICPIYSTIFIILAKSKNYSSEQEKLNMQ